MLFLASESDVAVVFGLGDPESVNIFDVLAFCSNYRTNKMSCMPMGVHAAIKVRDHLSNGPPGPDKNEQSEKRTKSMSVTEIQFNQPVQYNGKFMNAIWGAYNRYSVHNIKSHICFDKA